MLVLNSQLSTCIFTFPAFLPKTASTKPTIYCIMCKTDGEWALASCFPFADSQPAACIYDSLKVTLLKFAKHIIHMFGNLAWECPFGGILCTQYLFGGHEQSARWNNYHCVLIVSPLYRGGRFSAQLVLSGSLLPLEGVIIFWVINAALAKVLFPGKNICIIIFWEELLHHKSLGRRILWG